MAGRSGVSYPRCKYVESEWGCKQTAATRESDYCPHHHDKLVEHWAEVYAERFEEGATLDVALTFPVLDRPLGQLTKEERNAVGLWLSRAFPLVGEKAA